MPDPLASDSLRAALEQALGAQYQILRLLGRGGMGAVYLARERLLDRAVAIKVLPFENADDESRQRFVREARAVAQLAHPNIVPLLSFGETGGTLFYVMRFVEGESLEQRLRRDGALSPAESRAILSDIADALGEAHRLGIVHRDLKPDNVLIDRATGRALLTDFGVARQPSGTHTLTATGMIVGTPQYMSPEQATGDRAVDARADIYSLGVMAYRMVTGRLPFGATEMRELLMQQVTAPAPPISREAPAAPIDLGDAIMRCLEKEPARRWPDAASFRFAIQSSDDGAALPESLETVPSMGTRTVLMAFVGDIGLSVLFAATRDPEWLTLALMVSTLGIAIPLGITAFQVLREGQSWRRILPMVFWPTRRSVLWWPRALRPPDDVFDRLPRPVRRARIAQSIGIACCSVLAVTGMLGAFMAPATNVSLRRALLEFGSFSAIGGILAVFGASIRMMVWQRRWKLGRYDGSKLLTEPTHGSRFWSKPTIAALLGSASVARVDHERSVADMAKAIRELAASFSSAGTTIANQAAAVAGDIAKEVHGIDQQLKELASQEDPAERGRVDERLAALGEERENEPDHARQMRSLLRGQANLFVELDARRAAVQGHRDRMAEQLRLLLLELRSYRAQLSDLGGASDIAERVRELSRSIERRMSAIAETATM